MKFHLNSTLLLLILLLQFSCKQKSKESMDNKQSPTLKVKEAAPVSSVGVPIIQYKKDKVIIYQLIRNTKSKLEKSVTTKRSQDEIKVPVFSSEKRQFEVPIRKDHPIPDWKYEGVDTLVAISDIEGNFKALVSWLKGNRIITEDFKWSFGNNHLVFNGDVTDRGEEVFQVLWLIYKLEKEAEDQGGKVHLVFGNHEQLNTQGIYNKTNLKYVHPRYFQDAAVLGLDYAKWLSNQTELGRWIRTKNAIVQINDELFVHGGISPKLIESGLTIQEVNDINRSTLNIARKQYDKNQSLIARSDGPLWYRGLADQELTEAQVLEILNQYQCKKIIIGHTMVQEDNIESLYNGSIIPIDLPIKKNFRKGIVKGILINKEGVYELDNKKNRKLIKKKKD